MNLYESLGFVRLSEIESYYTMNDGSLRNCFLYAKFFHGNKPSDSPSFTVGDGDDSGGGDVALTTREKDRQPSLQESTASWIYAIFITFFWKQIMKPFFIFRR